MWVSMFGQLQSFCVFNSTSSFFIIKLYYEMNVIVSFQVVVVVEIQV